VFEDVPIAIEKAARIDGCTRLGTLFRVTIPTAVPGIAAAAILLLIGTWNEFLFAVILGDKYAVTITRRISFTESFNKLSETVSSLNVPPPAHVIATAGVMAVLPCLVLVLLFHRRIISGLTEGFVKA
jgi:multiple sugar transport system permease protein